MLSGSVFLDLQLTVIAALPVQDQHDMPVLEAHDDLMQNRPDNPLARSRCGCWVRPRQLQVGTQLQEPISFRVAQRGLLLALDRLELVFKVAHRDKRLVPTPFQLACDQAIVGIHRIVLAPGMAGLIAGLLQRELDMTTLFCLFGGLGGNRVQGGLYAQGLEQPQDLCTHRLVNA